MSRVELAVCRQHDMVQVHTVTLSRSLRHHLNLLLLLYEEYLHEFHRSRIDRGPGRILRCLLLV